MVVRQNVVAEDHGEEPAHHRRWRDRVAREWIPRDPADVKRVPGGQERFEEHVLVAFARRDIAKRSFDAAEVQGVAPFRRREAPFPEAQREDAAERDRAHRRQGRDDDAICEVLTPRAAEAVEASA